MTVRVRVGGHLRGADSRAAELDVPPVADVVGLVRWLDSKFPGLRDRVFDEHDSTRPYINIFLNGENVRELDGEKTKVGDGDVIYILPSVAGGSHGL